MAISLISVNDEELTIEIKINLHGSMLDMEESIQQSINEVGNKATGEALKKFDADGDKIEIGDVKFTSMGQVLKQYQTPYGVIDVLRHVYPTCLGGKTYCPLDVNARIIVTSTPRFAKIVSNKFANQGSTYVEKDLKENHGRSVARSFLQNLSDAVGSVVQAKEESWDFDTPVMDKPVRSVAIGVDGTCMLLCDDGYRQAMVGTISLYDDEGKRQHTTYLGATPEYGKATFTQRMEHEILHVKNLYPAAIYVGVADGAQDNWDFLGLHVERQILDFYHASSYLGYVATAAFPRDAKKRKTWLDEQCHKLKHEEGSPDIILKYMETLTNKRLNKSVKEKLESAITYFRNHKHQMIYSQCLSDHLPIGSGVTEAACKTLIKQRLCDSGMKWKERGASIVLSLRALVLTGNRWEQFWKKIDRYGVPSAA